MPNLRFSPHFMEDAGQTAAEPSGEALRKAYEEGRAPGRAEAIEEIMAEDTAREKVRFAVTRLDEKMTRELSDRLAATVAGLCEATLAPLALDADALQRRCEAAAAMVGEANPELVLALNPADIALLDPAFAASHKIEADPSLARGELRVEGSEGGVSDGPAQWRAAIETALSQC